MAPRPQLIQGCLCASSAQPNTDEGTAQELSRFYKQNPAAVALDLINSCWGIQPAARGQARGAVHVSPAPCQLPLLLRELGNRWWVTVLRLPSLLNGFVPGWERGRGVMLTWDGVVLPQEFTFPSTKGTDVPCVVAKPQASQYKPCLCYGCAVGLAEQRGKGWGIVPSVALKHVCLLRHCQPLCWGPRRFDSEKVGRPVLWERFT